MYTKACTVMWDFLVTLFMAYFTTEQAVQVSKTNYIADCHIHVKYSSCVAMVGITDEHRGLNLYDPVNNCGKRNDKDCKIQQTVTKQNTIHSIVSAVHTVQWQEIPQPFQI